MKFKFNISNQLLTVNFAAILLFTNSVYAQAYSWTEPGGKTVYGTTPPKSASNVKNLSPRGLSKYSSSKVLNRLGWRGSLATDLKTEDFNSANKDFESQNLDTVGVLDQGDVPAIDNLPITEEPNADEKQSPAKLENKIPKITLDEFNEKIISRCKVEVTNNGGQAANNVVVAFEFRDGTMIPAIGPASIPAGESITYKISPDLLPVKLNFALARKSPEKSLKVVLDWQK